MNMLYFCYNAKIIASQGVIQLRDSEHGSLEKSCTFARGLQERCLFTFHFHHVNWNLLFSHAEDFEVGHYTLGWRKRERD